MYLYVKADGIYRNCVQLTPSLRYMRIALAQDYIVVIVYMYI